MLESINEAIVLFRQAKEQMINSNLEEAKKLFISAGDLFLFEVNKLSAYDKLCANYSAAVAYFNGGDYRKSLDCAIAVPYGSLKEFDSETSEIYKLSKERLSLDYYTYKLAEITNSINHNEWNNVITILRNNPYLMSALDAATIRCVALKKLERHEEAALFEIDVERLVNDFKT